MERLSVTLTRTAAETPFESAVETDRALESATELTSPALTPLESATEKLAELESAFEVAVEIGADADNALESDGR